MDNIFTASNCSSFKIVEVLVNFKNKKSLGKKL